MLMRYSELAGRIWWRITHRMAGHGGDPNPNDRATCVGRPGAKGRTSCYPAGPMSLEDQVHNTAQNIIEFMRAHEVWAAPISRYDGIWRIARVHRVRTPCLGRLGRCWHPHLPGRTQLLAHLGSRS